MKWFANCSDIHTRSFELRVHTIFRNDWLLLMRMRSRYEAFVVKSIQC